jgi:aminodeoxyfutalosine synthase
MADLLSHINNAALKKIADKISSGKRISSDEGIILYDNCDLPLLGMLAGIVRRKLNNNFAYFNRNFHIEPTNNCIYNCLFCSYHKPAGDPESWELNSEQIIALVKHFDNENVTEVHITGGVDPLHDIYYYGELIKNIKTHRPSIHVKAYSAVEFDYMIKKAGMTIEEGLIYLQKCGLGSIPGGGAEIFDETIREKICPEKTSSAQWLAIHETAHKLGIPSNSTMLYGHIETYAHRIAHMERLRNLQDKTGGFNAFIPLKYKKADNPMGYLGELSLTEDLRNYAVSRIYLDNIPHLKAYWPMTGKEAAQLSLLFGADDLDGTIYDTTRIYSMAGAADKNPATSADELIRLIKEAGFEPVERDSEYKAVK